MRIFDAELFNFSAQALAQWNLFAQNDWPKDPVNPFNAQGALAIATSLQEKCAEAGLAVTAEALTEFASHLRDYRHPMKGEEIAQMTSEIQMTLLRELRSQLFFQVPNERRSFFEAKDLFGPEVTQKYPSAVSDIAEAGRCFALGRYPACVFHLMRVAEVALLVIARRMETIQIKNHTWGWIISDILSALKDMPDTNERKLLLREPAIYLSEVKHLWRDPSVHVLGADFSPERTESIYNSIRSFMQRLVEKGVTEVTEKESA